MKFYYKVDFYIKPYISDAADLLAAFLADAGFESFVETEDGLTAYAPEELFNEEAVAEAVNSNPFPAVIEWRVEKIEQKDWNEEWEKNYFQPLLLGEGRCVVHATFHQNFPHADYEILIDPKMAFGTGHHATTSMMVNHLLNNNIAGKRVMDMGTGTGILAILAAKLGAKEVSGIEIDEFAFQNTIENGRLNNVDVNFILGDASKLNNVKIVDIFLANINRNIILGDLEKYVATLAPEGMLFLSGFYQEDVPVIEEALQQNGMKIASVLTEGDRWASIKATF